MTATIEVLLVDDHAVVREGYKRLLERGGDIVVVGEAASASEAYNRVGELEPHVVVMDIALPGASGIEALRRILSRQAARVLMFSMYSDAIYARRALEAGAAGYLTKASAPEVLVEAVRAVARNERYLSRDIAQALALQTDGDQQRAVDALSPREHEVLRLWMQGHALSQIAATLGLSQKTVANHQSSIKQKLHADTAVQLLRNATKLGLAPESAMQ